MPWRARSQRPQTTASSANADPFLQRLLHTRPPQLDGSRACPGSTDSCTSGSYSRPAQSRVKGISWHLINSHWTEWAWGVAGRSLSTRAHASLLQLISRLRKEFKRQTTHETCIRVFYCSLQLRVEACWKDTTRETRMNSALIQFLSSSLPSTGKPRSSITNNLIPNNITSVTLNLEAKHLDPEKSAFSKTSSSLYLASPANWSKLSIHNSFPPAPRYSESF